MGTLPLQDLLDFQKVKQAVLQTFNLNLEAYRRWLRKIEFRTDYQLRLIAQRVKKACLKWLHPSERTTEEVAKDVCV